MPPGPAIIWANEFLDCLSIRQAVRIDGEWRERMVALDPDDESRFVFAAGPALGQDDDLVPPRLADAADGSLVELRPGDRQVVDALAARFANQPGCALFIDYGPAQSELGDTLQALKSHEKVPPLESPGTADLTARVDFESLGAAARDAGLSVFGPVPQGQFLTGLGIEARAAALLRANPAQKALIARQLWRLTDHDQMGELFKVMVIGSADMPQPPGFDVNG